MKSVVMIGAVAVAVGGGTPTLPAAVDLATPFADGMVLQRGREVPVWGRAEPGKKVTVAFAGNSAAAVACEKGCWKVMLPAMAASKVSRVLKATEEGGNTVEIKDVLVGEVWMCSGQSNTDCPVWGGSPRYRDGMGAMSIQTTVKPFVRLVKTPLVASVTPKRDYRAKWVKMTPQDFGAVGGGTPTLPGVGGGTPPLPRAVGGGTPTLPRMPSAMGYYYALELANALDIPIGLVDSSWGGTNIDAWTPRSGYEGLPELKDVAALPLLADAAFQESKKNGAYKGTRVYGGWIQQPTALWNGMVAAYAPMACRGFIWYQGCHNAGEHQRYCAKMHALYNGWAKEFKNPDLKLYFVQLTPWGSDIIPHIQVAQAKFDAEEKNAGMAVINDVGNLTDIHPNDKRTVAKRLAVHALKRDYGWNWVKDDSPTFKAMKIEGDKVTLSFDNVESWYLYNPKMGDRSTGFELAGADGVFKKADVQNFHINTNWRGGKEFWGNIDGKDIVLRAAGVPAPKKVRYLYTAPWFGGLYNEVCLPLGAFKAE